MSAATALLTGFLLSPFIQGAITYPTRTLEAGDGTATIATSESYFHPRPYGKRTVPQRPNPIPGGVETTNLNGHQLTHPPTRAS